MNRIKKIVNVIRFLVSASVIYMVVVGLVFLIDLVAGVHFLPRGIKVSFSPGLTYSAPFQIPAVALVLASFRMGLFLTGSLILFWLLDLFEEGKVFAAQSVSYVKLLGWLVLADWLVVRLLDWLAKALNPDVGQLGLGLLIVLIAWIMDEGRKIQEEQALTV